MNEFRFNLERLPLALRLAGWMAIGAGFFVALYTSFFLRPKIQAVTDAFHTSTRQFDALTEAIGKNGSLVSASLQLAESGGDLALFLPQTLTQLQSLLKEAARASRVGGEAAKQTQKGVAGLVTPKKQLKETNVALKGTARRMNALAQTMGKWHRPAVEIADSAQVLTRDIAAIRSENATIQSDFSLLEQQALAAAHALDSFALPLQVTLMGLGMGGLLCLVGFFLLLVASALEPNHSAARRESRGPPLQAA